jgi:outer membrane protein assembly factor BamA
MYSLKTVFSLLFGIFCFISITAGQSVMVTAIEIHGLKRTKESIVRRELTVAVGDSILQSELGATMEKNRGNLLNLGIFNEVGVNVSEWNTETHEVEITIDVKESWYIYLLPILDLADRNFNVWWNTYNHELDRLNLGGQLDFLNFTGYNDKFKAKLQFGYTPKQEIEYRFPYFNKRQSLGLTIGGLHSINKEVNYETRNNKEQFFKLNDHKLQERWKWKMNLQFRPSIYLRHTFETSFEYLKMDPQILDYNPRLFRKGGTNYSALALTYSFEYDDRDLKIYPSKGIRVNLAADKIGWGNQDDENTLTVTSTVEGNMQQGKRFQHRLSGIGHYSLSRSQPSYFRYHALGYEQKYVRGYELYAIDGLDYVIGKYQLSYNVFQTKFKFGKYIPVEEFRDMTFEVFLSLYAETGYANDPFTSEFNQLANQWLRGGGFGLDFLLYHNFLFQLNLNTNHLGEWGFFIHNKTSF